jgi:hypothetical protein
MDKLVNYSQITFSPTCCNPAKCKLDTVHKTKSRVYTEYSVLGEGSYSVVYRFFGVELLKLIPYPSARKVLAKVKQTQKTAYQRRIRADWS